MEQTTRYAIELDPDFANFYPAVPYPGTALYEKCVREGLLPARGRRDWSKMEYSYYLLRGNGLDDRVVMEAINRAKRRFFLRPGYVAAPRRRRGALAIDQAGDRLAGAVAHGVRRAGRGHVARRRALAACSGRDRLAVRRRQRASTALE